MRGDNSTAAQVKEIAAFTALAGVVVYSSKWLIESAIQHYGPTTNAIVQRTNLGQFGKLLLSPIYIAAVMFAGQVFGGSDSIVKMQTKNSGVSVDTNALGRLLQNAGRALLDYIPAAITMSIAHDLLKPQSTTGAVSWMLQGLVLLSGGSVVTIWDNKIYRPYIKNANEIACHSVGYAIEYAGMVAYAIVGV